MLSPTALSSPLSAAPSSPLSIMSRSPSPPNDYPSPPLTNTVDSDAPIRASTQVCFSEERPFKKRRLGTPQPRTTEKLNLQTLGTLRDPGCVEHQMEQIERLVHALRHRRKIVVIAGAGISVSAGIPDFRSSKGLFTTLRSQHKLKSSGKALFDASVYRDDSSTASFHSMVRELATLTQKAQPTLFHHMLASIAEGGRLLRLYTQNVDGIDTGLPPLATRVPLNAKAPWPRTIQLHGGLEKMVCSKCMALFDFDASKFEGSEAPSCMECTSLADTRQAVGLRCHGIGCLRPRMVLYNEFNPDSEAIGNVSHADLRTRPDAVIVVGTSLKIPGIKRLVKELCAVTRDRKDGFTAWINLDDPPTEFKDWDVVVSGNSDEVARLVNLPHWQELAQEDYSVVTTDNEQNIVDRKFLDKVEVPSTPQSTKHFDVTAHEDTKIVMGEKKPLVIGLPSPFTGMLTPGASPRPNSQPVESSSQILKTDPPSMARVPLPDVIFGNTKVQGPIKRTQTPTQARNKARAKRTTTKRAKELSARSSHTSLKNSLKMSKVTHASVADSPMKLAETSGEAESNLADKGQGDLAQVSAIPAQE